MNESRVLRPQLSLELAMRDVLGNMEELVSEFTCDGLGDEFTIVSIEPTRVPDAVTENRSGVDVTPLFSATLYQLPLSA
ncbi:MAG: hypothetical protein OEZ16_06865 [Chromatiales bacterium]|nr:hypothetical protein [Chromatiales bacterium]